MGQKPLYFHAQYRRSMTTREKPVYTILDGVKGMGKYVGTYLAWNAASSGWWGEGEVKFYLDGDDFPSIADNGCEDYFGGSFGFSKLNGTACADEEVRLLYPLVWGCRCTYGQMAEVFVNLDYTDGIYWIILVS